jgi:(1->4)-alpha-D-glucan 1-alpha-D-glucosylmutase
LGVQVNVRHPSSTYRIQLRSGLTLGRLPSLLDYFEDLGISDLYLSPIFRAHSESPHGYAVVDFNDIDPRVGTVEELAELARLLRERDMGLLLDVVTNHMSASPMENRWWRDVLEMGLRSTFARFFDVDWNHPDPDLEGRVLVPVLTEPYPKALETSLRLSRTMEGLFVAHGRKLYPLAPATWTAAMGNAALEEPPLRGLLAALDGVLGGGARILSPLTEAAWTEKERIKEEILALLFRSESLRERVDESLSKWNESVDGLRSLLDRQAYRFAHFREAGTRINYRRFFDINDLVALRVEDPEVFLSAHAFLFSLIEQGWIQGLRIDHIDGLLDPKGYLERLPRNCYVVVEKVLAVQERLRADWPVEGTTGYEVLNRIERVFVRPEGETALVGTFHELTGDTQSFHDVVRQSKLDAVEISFGAELASLVRRLVLHLRNDGREQGFATVQPEDVQTVLEGLVASFPVYRTYLRPGERAIEDEDRRVLASATSAAKRLLPRHEALIDRVSELLSAPNEIAFSFQQLTGPVTAKGLEDTAFYRYYPLASLNEVGSGPSPVGNALEEFHQRNRESAARWPHGLSCTSTHDTKRDEDVRARLNVLSEVPEKWHDSVLRWREWNQRHKRFLSSGEAPDVREEYLLYQTLLGTWPLEPLDARSHREYVERITGYLVKALREAKRHTSWLSPDRSYEEAASDFVSKLLDPNGSVRFLDDFAYFEKSIREAGLLNGLSQTLLKATVPGAPDFYQGTELWALRLVDPDNRGPVDYDRRRAMLESVIAEWEKGGDGGAAFLERSLRSLEDGTAKLYLIWRLLQLRKGLADLFSIGSYVPLAVEGDRGEHVIAFYRAHGEQRVVVTAARFFSALPTPPTGDRAWSGTLLTIPEPSPARYREALSGQPVEVRPAGTHDSHRVELADAFRHAPFAVLEPLGEKS